MRTLPDLLRAPLGCRLDVVFAGINPGERSAQLGHYYAHPGNAFWRALEVSPLAEGSLAPDDDRALPARLGIGFTDVVKRVVTDSTQVTAGELRAAAPHFERRIGYARPRAVCFTNTRAFEALFPRAWRAGCWGPQGLRLADAEVWVMPSTSGRAAAYRGEVARVLEELAASLGREAGPGTGRGQRALEGAA
jgi:TDG/mug DNA glycosylase family protein